MEHKTITISKDTKSKLVSFCDNKGLKISTLVTKLIEKHMEEANAQ